MARRRRSYGLRTRISQGLPDSVMLTMTYSKLLLYDGTSSVEHQVFRGNSIFDPDLTSSTGDSQPIYFDQYSNLYGRYMVYSSVVSATIVNEGLATTTVGLYPATDSANTINNVDELNTQPYLRSRLVPNLDSGGALNMRNPMTTAKMRGGLAFSEEWGALTTQNPTRAWYWHIHSQITGPGNVEMTIRVTIRYRVRWYKRNQVGQSLVPALVLAVQPATDD